MYDRFSWSKDVTWDRILEKLQVEMDVDWDLFGVKA